MTTAGPWVGTWRPHQRRGTIAALYRSPGPKYALPGLTGGFQHDPTRSKAPVFSMGVRCKDVKTERSPGPSHLVPANITRTGRAGTPAFSLHSRCKEPQTLQSPGPGRYVPEHSVKSVLPCPPAYSLSGRIKERGRDKTPGPASYSLPAVLGPRTVSTSSMPAWTLCGRNTNRSFHQDLSKTPGPAAYSVVDPCTYRQKPPQFSMTGRSPAPGDSAHSQGPGPGAHHPEKVSVTKTNAPSFSFGLRHSEYLTLPTAPRED